MPDPGWPEGAESPPIEGGGGNLVLVLPARRCLSLPIDPYEVTGYGFGRQVKTRTGTMLHLGQDLHAEAGSPVLAVVNGPVIYAHNHPPTTDAAGDLKGNWGGLVLQKATIGGKTIALVYGHLDPNHLPALGQLSQGKQIGQIATQAQTGYAPHLHMQASTTELSAAVVAGYATTTDGWQAFSDWASVATRACPSGSGGTGGYGGTTGPSAGGNGGSGGVIGGGLGGNGGTDGAAGTGGGSSPGGTGGAIPTASCSLPWGGSIASGRGTIAYQTSSVACGNSCTSQTRTCTNGTLSGSYTNSACSVSCPSETCNGLDDDANGIVDDPPSCWTTIYRFKNPSNEARCWNSTTTAPSACSTYGYEREAFLLHKAQVTNTFPLVQCSKSTDHILVDGSSGDPAALTSAGYNCSLTLGYAYTLGTIPTTPWPYGCPLYRFSLTTGGSGAHIFTVGTDSTSGLTCEPPARASVPSNQACFASKPSGC